MAERRIKILFIITQGEMGGAQRYVYDLAVNITDKYGPAHTRTDADRYYEIMVAVGEGGGELKSRLEEKNIAVKILQHLRRNIHPFDEVAAIFELKKLIKNYQPDIVHLNSSKAGVIGSLAARLAGNNHVVFTAHGFAFLEPHLFSGLYFWAEKFASRFRRRIITVSEYDRQAAIKAGLCEPEKLVVIHNGISRAEQKHYDLPYPSSRGGEKITIGTIAYDYPTKDLNTLRRAFEIVKKEYPQAELKIVSNVPDAAGLLSTFSIYACSSVKEGFPYTILEAMAAGLPIASTNVGGIPEMLTPRLISPARGEETAAGILVPPKNPQALAAAIKKLIADPQLAQVLGNNARKKVQEFSLDRMIRETERIYKLITGN